MRRALALGAGLAALLVIFGAATTPGFLASRSGAIGVVAVCAVLGAYVFAGLWAAPRIAAREPQAAMWAARLGWAAGGVYAAEVLLEYAVLPADNTVWGLVEFGMVFAAFLVCGLLSGWRTRRLGSAVLAGAWTAMGAAVAWYVVVLAVFYLFRGSARQASVLGAEGDFGDFRRSGEASLQVFLMGDFLGAGFFHLVLSPLIGAVLGLVGGLLALGARRVADPRTA